MIVIILIHLRAVPSVQEAALKECLIFENIVYSVKRNAKSYNLKRVQTDGERLIFAEQLTEKDRFHLKYLLLDMQKGEVITGEMMCHRLVCC